MMKIINQLSWLHWIFVGSVLLIATGAAGMVSGIIAGNRDREANLALFLAADVQNQYDLALKDFYDGNYALARQRFDYVLQQDPGFPGVTDMLAESILRQTTPVVIITDLPKLTMTPSPTPDTRQADDLFAQAERQLGDQDWDALVQTIVTLRDIDPSYRTLEVDRMLFLGLHHVSIQKILDDGDLEGGLYDLALVERFAPLDSQSLVYRDWARLYQIGVSFWGVLPEKSVYYFSQLASAAPYLRDLSGFYAKERYRQALIQYGNLLSQTGDWCLAVEQYNLAQNLLEEGVIAPTVTFAEEQCSTGDRSTIPTLVPETEMTPTLSVTASLTETMDTPSPTIEITLTPTQIEPTLEPTTTITLTPTQAEVTPEPSPTESVPTETPIPTATTETSP